MTVKKLLSPKGADYPLDITETFVGTGERIEAGAKLYALRTQSGREVLMRAPIAGEVVGAVLKAGAQLGERGLMLTIDDAPEEMFAELEEADAPAESGALPSASSAAKRSGFAMTDKIMSMVPDGPSGAAQAPEPEDRAPEPAKAASPATVQKAEESVLGGIGYLAFVSLAFALPVAAIYAALHVVHSATFSQMAGVLILLGVFAVGWLLVKVFEAVTGVEELTLGWWIGGLGFGGLLALASAFASLDALKRYSAPWLHELVAPITGGPVLMIKDQLYILGRHVDLPDYPTIGRAYRLGDYGAVLDERVVLTDSGKVVVPSIALRRAGTKANPNVQFHCMNYEIDAILSGASRTARTADDVSFFARYAGQSSLKEGYLFKLDSAGKVLSINEVRGSNNARTRGCGRDYRTLFNVPQA